MGPTNPFDPSNLRSPAGAAFYFTFVDPGRGGPGRGGGGRNGCGCVALMLVVALLIGILIAALTNS